MLVAVHDSMYSITVACLNFVISSEDQLTSLNRSFCERLCVISTSKTSFCLQEFYCYYRKCSRIVSCAACCLSDSLVVLCLG